MIESDMACDAISQDIIGKTKATNGRKGSHLLNWSPRVKPLRLTSALQCS